MIEARVLKQSVWNGSRIVSYELTYPKYLVQELNTHRQTAKNTQSSRAVPTSKLSAQEMFYPCFWPSNQKGMKAGPALDEDTARVCKAKWDTHVKDTIDLVKFLSEQGLHKEVANRPLEFCTLAKTIFTATDDNLLHFFNLRLHTDADNNMMYLAWCMFDALKNSVPVVVSKEQAVSYWHMPFEDPNDQRLPIKQLLMVDAAKCARVSYSNHLAPKPDSELLDLANLLVASGHMSPFEHQARPVNSKVKYSCHNPSWYTLRSELEVTQPKPQWHELFSREKEIQAVLHQRGFTDWMRRHALAQVTQISEDLGLHD